MALTAKKKAFAEHFHASGYKSQTASATAAGYSVNGARVTGSKLARDPDVLRHLEYLKAKEDGTLKTYRDPMDVLIDLMNESSEKTRLAAASVLMPYHHARVEDIGKKATKREAAKEAAAGGGRFATLANQKIQ